MSQYVTLSNFAVANIKDLLRDNDMEGYGLYLGIRGGGCSGYSYCLEFRDKPEGEDLVLEQDGLRVFVGLLKRDYLKGTVVDYEDTLIESGFKIRNPNAKRHCGCGESFDIDDEAGAGAY